MQVWIERFHDSFTRQRSQVKIYYNCIITCIEDVVSNCFMLYITPVIPEYDHIFSPAQNVTNFLARLSSSRKQYISHLQYKISPTCTCCNPHSCAQSTLHYIFNSLDFVFLSLRLGSG